MQMPLFMMKYAVERVNTFDLKSCVLGCYNVNKFV